MKKLCIMAFTIALLAWASMSQATILNAPYANVGTGSLDSTATWDGDSLQLTITGSQASQPAGASGAFTNDCEADPTVTLYNALNNDSKNFVWTRYEIFLTASKAVTLLNPSVDDPAGWSINVSPVSADGTQWEVDVFDTTGRKPIVPGDELDFSYQMKFSGSLQYTQALSPMGTIAVPEPGTLILALGGLLGLAVARGARRRRA